MFAPRKGDRILSINYKELVPPVNWLEVDPPCGKSAWNTEGRRLLWKDHIEAVWHQSVEQMKSVNPSYVELGRGVGGDSFHTQTHNAQTQFRIPTPQFPDHEACGTLQDG